MWPWVLCVVFINGFLVVFIIGILLLLILVDTCLLVEIVLWNTTVIVIATLSTFATEYNKQGKLRLCISFELNRIIFEYLIELID